MISSPQLVTVLRYLHILEIVDYSGYKSDVLECDVLYFVVLPIWKPRWMRDAWCPLVLDTRKRDPSQPLHSKQLLRTDNDPQDRSFYT